MKRYSEYKDSGVKWIGEIPGHWECTRIKFIANLYGRIGFRGYNSKDLNKDGIGAITLSPSNMKDMMMDYTNVTYLSWEKYNESPEIMIQQGDILFVKTGSSYGKSCYVDNLPQEATINPQILRINPLINGRFLCYYFNSSLARTFTECGVVGGTIPTISQEKVGNFIALNPPLPEQEAIVTYLDTKVAKIDEYISIAEKKIAALEELKQTIIAEAVTRGIHKDVPMKDSGVKWIGMIPEHWKIMRLRFVCEFRNGYTPSKANPKFWENGTIPWFRMEDIRDSGRFLNEAKQYISKEAVKGDGLFEAGSFILATTATIGEHAMLIADSLANQRFTNLKIRKSLISKLSRNFFFYYLFVIDEYCKSTTRKATFPSVDMTDLKNIGVSIPPIEEQQEIVTYLDSKVANINQLCQAERSQIEKLKEYKQRLISDVVTGKVKVTND